MYFRPLVWILPLYRTWGSFSTGQVWLVCGVHGVHGVPADCLSLGLVCESPNATLCRSSPPPRPSSLLHHHQQSHHQQIKFYEDFFLRFLKNHKNFHYTGKHQQTIDIKVNIATDFLLLWIEGRSLSFEGFIEVVVGRFLIEILSN